MKKIVSTLIIALLISLNFIACKQKEQPILAENNIPEIIDNTPKIFGEYKINNSITEGNLQIFLIDGKDKLSTKNYTTLAKAIDKNKVTVKETGNVNQLAISNDSDSYVFIHSGDIVKGGKQDRTIAQDVIIPPRSKDVPLESFCVEQGRWQKRSGENVHKFGSSNKMVSSRKLKLAAKYEKNQGKVWANVAEEQTRLKDNVSKLNGKDAKVKSDVSATSLQLTLESKELEEATKKLETTFKSILKNNNTAIGYAYAINGEIYGVDLYNNRQLFSELWEKISESIITESISYLSDKDFQLAKTDDVVDFMSGIETSGPKKTLKNLNKVTDLETFENSKDDVVFSTIDKEEKKWIHNNYMKKEKHTTISKSSLINQRTRNQVRN